MLTLDEMLAQRRQHLLDFFAWRFGIPNWTAALCYCTGLCAGTVCHFRRAPVSFNTLKLIENAALHLGYRPPRVLKKNGEFAPPKTLKLPRWSDAACRIRFYLWRKETGGGQRKTERKARRDKTALIERQIVTSAPVSVVPCMTNVYDNATTVATQAIDTAPPTSS